MDEIRIYQMTRRIRSVWLMKSDTKTRLTITRMISGKGENRRSALLLTGSSPHEDRDDLQDVKGPSHLTHRLGCSPTPLLHLQESRSRTRLYLRAPGEPHRNVLLLEDRNNSKAPFRLLFFHHKRNVQTLHRRHKLNKVRADLQSRKLAVRQRCQGNQWPG